MMFKYIVAKYFFKDYAPTVINWRKKLSGKNTNGNPIAFTSSDKAAIRKGLKQLLKDMAL